MKLKVWKVLFFIIIFYITLVIGLALSVDIFKNKPLDFTTMCQTTSAIFFIILIFIGSLDNHLSKINKQLELITKKIEEIENNIYNLENQLEDEIDGIRQELRELDDNLDDDIFFN